jgi:PAS domain S-box-containing protein
MTGDALDLVQTTLLGQAADNATLAIVVADENLRLLAVNRQASELFGYSRQELLELSILDLAPSEPREQFEELVGGRSLSVRTTAVHRDGARFPIRFAAVETRVAGMRVYVTLLEPVDGSDDGGAR